MGGRREGRWIREQSKKTRTAFDILVKIQSLAPPVCPHRGIAGLLLSAHYSPLVTHQDVDSLLSGLALQGGDPFFMVWDFLIYGGMDKVRDPVNRTKALPL